MVFPVLCVDEMFMSKSHTTHIVINFSILELPLLFSVHVLAVFYHFLGIFQCIGIIRVLGCEVLLDDLKCLDLHAAAIL